MSTKYDYRNYQALRPSVVAEVLASVEEITGIKPREILSQTRLKPIAHARQLAMWKLRQFKGPTGGPRYSYPEIAGFFDRDHTTVLFAERAVAARMVPETPE